jgi:V8-like Glu-specific endopeptidase
MKKVLLSLAVVAVLTVVSCKKTEEAPAAEAVDTTAVAVDTTAVVADTTAVVADTTAVAPAETPAK